MNKIYHTVWNETTGTWVAASEITTARGKPNHSSVEGQSEIFGGIQTKERHASLVFRRSILTVAIGLVFLQGSTVYAGYAAGDAVVSALNGIGIGTGNGVGTTISGTATDGNTIAIGGKATAYGSGAGGNGGSGFSQAIGQDSHAGANGAIAMGSGAHAGATGYVAAGQSVFNIAAAYGATAIGNDTFANGVSSVAIGGGNNLGNSGVGTATSDSAAQALGAQTIAIGRNAYVAATSSNGVAIGTGTQAASGALALGGFSGAGQTSTATTLGAQALGRDSIALGGQSIASKIGSVALGNAATTATDATTEASATLNGLTYGTFAGQVTDPGMQVSVGSVGAERQIKNVGSGAISATSTDAINGSQLYATNVVLGNAANSVQTILGGNAKLNSDGNITMTNIGGTGKNTIHDAIAASQEEVVAGTNIARVIKTTDATGVDTFTVNANGTTVSAAASGALTVVKSLPDANNVTDYSVDLSQTTKDKIDGALQEVVTQIDGTTVKTITKSNNTANFLTGKNIKLTPAAGGIEIATADNVAFTNVNTTNLNTTGVTNLGGTTNITGDAYYTGPITNGNNIVNKTYVDNSVTTLANNPLTFAGDTGTDVARKLGETLNIVGGNTGTLTDGNIGIEGNGTDTLTVKLASDLAGLNSVSITKGPTINTSGIDMNNTKITELIAGDVNSTSTDAVNGSQLYAVSDVANKGWNIATDSGAPSNVKPGDTATFIGDGKNIAVTNVGNTVTVALTKDINVDSITLNGKDGKDGISITGAVGAPGVNGTDGITRIIYKDPTTGEPTEVATLNDGLKFAGNTGDVIAKKLNETLTISGELAEGKDATGANLRVDSANGKLNLVMAKDLTDLNSIVINGGPTINNNGINMNGGTITKLAAGVADSDAVNVSQLKEVSNVANAGWNIATDSGTASNVKPGDTVNMKGDGSIVVSNKGNDVTVGLADVVTVGKGDTAVTIDGKKGSVTVGDTTINSDGLTIVGGPSVTKNGINAGDKQITDVASGLGGQKLEDVTGDDLKNAVNVGDLQTVVQDINTDINAAKSKVEAGKNVTVSSVSGPDGTVYTVATKDEVDFNKVTVGGLTIDKGNVDVAGNTIISGVGAGEISSTSTDAVNGSQLYATNQQVDQNTTNIAKNTTDITNINTTLDKGLNFSADSGSTINRKLGDTVAITGDSNIITTTTANGVQIKLSDNIDVKNVNVSQSITVAEGANVNMGGNVIQNVGAGVADTDAVNVGQLKNVANHISNVEDKLSGGIAASAALAVVTPVEPGTYHLSGGTAYYNGGYGVGFNLLKRSDNGRTTMHAGVAWGSGGGGALVRIGAGFSFGGN